MNTNLARTPLADWHVAHGGRMVDFAGWSMPVQYSSIVDEHVATRTAAGLFDISHMGRLRFDGPAARDFLDHLLTRRVANMRPGQVRYSLLTNDTGGILDDVLLYALNDAQGQEYWILVVNAGNRLKAVDWITGRLQSASGVNSSLIMRDLTLDWAMIAVQGPRALGLLQPLVNATLADMRYYTAVEALVNGSRGIVSRTGYTGEDGCELIVEAAQAPSIWQKLIDGGARACGLGCRDTLRLEAAMPLYGHELNESINPWQAGLAFAVDTDGRSFPGRDALAAARTSTQVPQRLGIKLAGKRVPREGYAVCDRNGAALGEVTSGTFSPTLNCPIAMAYLAPSVQVGNIVNVDLRGKFELGEIVELPFYRRPK